MKSKSFQTPGNTDKEKEIWSGTCSSSALYSNLVFLGLIGFIAGLVIALIPSVRAESFTWKIYTGALMACGLVHLGLFFYQRMSRWYIVTTERIIHREGILIRRHYILELIRVDDVTFEQGPIEAMFGCGSIFVSTSDTSHPELELTGIAKVRDVANMIDGHRRSERKQRGLHVEQI